MATFSVVTTGTDATETLLAEEIQRQLLVENRPPMVAMAIAQGHDFNRKGASRTQNIVRLKTVAARTQSTEGTELTADDMDFDEESLSPTTRYVRRNLTWQGQKDSVVELKAAALAQGFRAILEATDSTGLTTFQTAISSVGSSSDTMGMDEWSTGAATYEALNPQGSLHHFVMHAFTARDMRNAIRSASASIFADGHGRDLFGAVNGFMGEFEGYMLWKSTNVSETGSAKINAFISHGVLRHGIWDPFQVATDNDIAFLADIGVVWGRDGWVLATNGEASTGADSSITKVLTKNS